MALIFHMMTPMGSFEQEATGISCLAIQRIRTAIKMENSGSPTMA